MLSMGDRMARALTGDGHPLRRRRGRDGGAVLATAAAPPQSSPDDFALMRGGPFFELMRTLGLDAPEHPVRTMAARFAFGLAVAGVPLLLLCWLEGSLRALVSDQRVISELFLALPVLLAGEPYVNGRLASAARRPLLLEMLSPDDVRRFHASLVRAARLRDDRWVEGVLVLLAYGMTLGQLGLGTAVSGFAARGGALTAAGAWYALVSHPLLWFVLLRWALRYAIWCAVLLRLSGLELRLTALHADKTGGLRFLAGRQASFSVVVFAVGSIVSARTGGGPAALSTEGLLSYAREQVLFALMALVILNLPLVSFSRKLLETRQRVGGRLSALVARHARDFESKWSGQAAPEQTPLGHRDMSSQTDITTAYEQARKMRWFPYGSRPTLAVIASGLLLPLVPRLLADRQLLDALLRAIPKIF